MVRKNRQRLAAVPERHFAGAVHGSARSLSTGRKRGLAAWLLLGWMTFWLATAVQPCGVSFAAQQQGNPTATPAILDAGDHQAHTNDSHDPVPAGTHCPDLTAIATVATSVAAAPADRLDPSRPLPSSSGKFFARRDQSALNLHHPFPAPPPHAPLYLRNQRLLI